MKKILSICIMLYFTCISYGSGVERYRFVFGEGIEKDTVDVIMMSRDENTSTIECYIDGMYFVKTVVKDNKGGSVIVENAGNPTINSTIKRVYESSDNGRSSEIGVLNTNGCSVGVRTVYKKGFDTLRYSSVDLHELNEFTNNIYPFRISDGEYIIIKNEINKNLSIHNKIAMDVNHLFMNKYRVFMKRGYIVFNDKEFDEFIEENKNIFKTN